MINLRYHIVSIVGIFLALGIGVALGSTFVDGFVVSTLEDRVNNLEGDRNDLRDQLGEVQEELAVERAERAAQEVAAIPLMGAGRLQDVPVMLIATDGVDDAAFLTIRAALLSTAAQYEGTLWLTDRLDLSDEGNREDLAEVLALPGRGETLVRRALELRLLSALFPPPPDEAGTVLGDTALDVVGDLLEEGDLLSVDPPEPNGQLTSVLTQLRDAAFVRYDNEFASTGSLADVPTHDTRFIVVSGAGAELAADELLYSLFDAVVADEEVDVTIVAVEPAPLDEDDGAVEFVGPLRDDPEYRSHIATVDHVTTFEGLLAMLHVLDTTEVLHLGVGPAATSVLPAP